MTGSHARAARPTILLAGATGNIGSELVKQLSTTGYPVRALVRDSEKAGRIASHATPFVGDLSLPETLAPAFDGAERIFILCPTSPHTELLERNAFDVAAAAGAKR